MVRPRVTAVLLAMLLPWLAWAITAPTLPPFLEPFFAAIRAQESRGQPWAIFNNTTRQSFVFSSRAEAEQRARELIGRGHNLDLGLYQLNWRYQGQRPGVSLANVFDPAVNEAIARQVFLEFFQAARARYADLQEGIRMAVGAYNNGRVAVHNPRYVNAVYRLAGRAAPYSAEDATAPPAAAVLSGAATGPLGTAEPVAPDTGARLPDLWPGEGSDDSTALAQAGEAAAAAVIAVVVLVLLLVVLLAALFLFIKFVVPLLVKKAGWGLARLALRAGAAVNARTQRTLGLK